MHVNPEPITWELRAAKDIKAGDVIRYKGNTWVTVEDTRALLHESNPQYVELSFGILDPHTLGPDQKLAVRI